MVVLAPGGARNVLRDAPVRRWPVERYAIVARALIERGCEVALTGDEGDRWVLDAFAGVAIRDVVGRASLNETLKLLAAASLVVSLLFYGLILILLPRLTRRSQNES